MKAVWFFRKGEAEGGRDDRRVLGGKGADLAEMCRLGVEVPPGFTVSTEVCMRAIRDGAIPDDVRDEVRGALARLEEVRGRELGATRSPLLLSVRSGAAISMPGMMDTVLDLGCNRQVVEALAEESGDRRFALDTYRRLIQMFTNVVEGAKLDEFEHILDQAIEDAGVDGDTQLPAERLEWVIDRFLATFEEAVGEPFPEDPAEQVERAIAAVFNSWNTRRARTYRRLHGIADDLGTAANVQTMVFGNLNDRSGSGVAFSRDPADGAPRLYGEWLPRAQGEDVVAGVRTPQPISRAQRRPGSPESLEERLPEVFRELRDVSERLERHYADMLDMEFTVEDGHLWMLQSRRGKRTAVAAVRIAVDLVDEGLVDRRTALIRVDADTLEQLLHPRVGDTDVEPLGEGLPASPGAAHGAIVFDANEAEERGARGEEVILVRPMTVADDVGGMAAARGVLTSRGGMTSHAAVVARGMGIPCVTGASGLHIDPDARTLSAGGRVIEAGERITIDGTHGRVFAGEVSLEEPEPGDAFERLMRWSDEERRLGVRANADTGPDAARARQFGAEGIGLCRTEHMFFDPERLEVVQRMILAADADGRRQALERLEPMQRADFIDIFEAMDGLPVTIRLLDPPLHEFLPENEDEMEGLAADLGLGEALVRARIRELRDENPMLGHRGCRVGVTAPDIYRMQVRAALRAAAHVREAGGDPVPEIMVPLVAAATELQWIRENVVEPAAAEVSERGGPVDYRLGVMIETPRACLDAEALAAEAHFFSLGTNDLTQMTWAFSRDDSGEFLPAYRHEHLLADDPFQHVDEAGVGELAAIAVERGRRGRPDLVVGVCGEHGGDPRSIALWNRLGLDYVSCSPFRVPGARLAAARAAVEDR